MRWDRQTKIKNNVMMCYRHQHCPKLNEKFVEDETWIQRWLVSRSARYNDVRGNDYCNSGFSRCNNPPDGVWQEDIHYNSNSTIHRSFHSSNTLKTFMAGSAVMAYPASCQGNYYTAYLITNFVSFFASICVIMFMIGRLPLKNRICAWLLTEPCALSLHPYHIVIYCEFGC